MFGETIWNNIFSIKILNAPIETTFHIYVLNRYFTLQVVAIIFQMFQSKAMKTRLENLAFNEGRKIRRGWDQQQIPPWHQGSLNYL